MFSSFRELPRVALAFGCWLVGVRMSSTTVGDTDSLESKSYRTRSTSNRNRSKFNRAQVDFPKAAIDPLLAFSLFTICLATTGTQTCLRRSSNIRKMYSLDPSRDFASPCPFSITSPSTSTCDPLQPSAASIARNRTTSSSKSPDRSNEQTSFPGSNARRRRRRSTTPRSESVDVGGTICRDFIEKYLVLLVVDCWLAGRNQSKRM